MTTALASVWDLAIILALVFANAFFVAAEFALVTVRPTRVNQLIAEGSRRAHAVRRALNDSDRYIAATQLGITIASLGLGWIGEPAIAALIEPLLKQLPARVAEASLHTIAVVVGFSVITALHIVLGELAPKTIALQRAEATALWVAHPTEWFMKAFWPFIAVLNGLGRRVVRVLGFAQEATHAHVHSPEELGMLVTESAHAGLLDVHERDMLHRVLEIGELTAAQVMVPRTELAAIPITASPGDLAKILDPNPPSWAAIHRETRDDMAGVILLKDVAAMLLRAQPFDLASILRPLPVVPETLHADEVLIAMQQQQAEHALVVDEYGGVAGIVSADDVNRRLAGNVVSKRSAGSQAGGTTLDGLALLADVVREFGLPVEHDNVNTIGGYVLERLGRTPRPGDRVTVDGWTLTVEAMDGLRVARVRLTPPAVRNHNPHA
jgi:CBS domain containing-hemolysin-like protein